MLIGFLTRKSTKEWQKAATTQNFWLYEACGSKGQVMGLQLQLDSFFDMCASMIMTSIAPFTGAQTLCYTNYIDPKSE